jgi:Helix-turn-helix domain
MSKQRKINENMAKTFTGIWIPKNIWLSNELTPIQMLVLMQIAALDNDFGCKASNEHIGEFFGVHATTISEHIQNLQRLDFITCQYEDQKGKAGRTIKCTRKFKLLTAGLLDEIEEYTATHRGNTEGGRENTAPPRENTIGRITLEEHLGSLSGVDPETENQILEFSNSICSHPMYPVQIQSIQNSLTIPEEIKEKIDELALQECVIAMITDGKSSVGHWAGYLKTAYSKAISNFVTNSRTKIQIQKNEYYEGKKTNQAANPVENKPAFFDTHPQLQPITEKELFDIGVESRSPELEEIRTITSPKRHDKRF